MQVLLATIHDESAEELPFKYLTMWQPSPNLELDSKEIDTTGQIES